MVLFCDLVVGPAVSMNSDVLLASAVLRLVSVPVRVVPVDADADENNKLAVEVLADEDEATVMLAVDWMTSGANVPLLMGIGAIVPS